MASGNRATEGTFKQGRKPGRSPIDSALEGWILQVTRDNPTLGYGKLEEELCKLGIDVGATTICTILLRCGVPAQAERSRQGSSWRMFLNHYKDQFLVFTVETLTLHTPCVLFFLEHATRRVHLGHG